MTDEELKRIEERFAKEQAVSWAVPPLVSEVRRLRGLIARSIEISGPACSWCERITSIPKGAVEHDPNCPAFTPDGSVR